MYINKRTAFSILELSIILVILGILISGISSGIDLYQEYRNTTARSLSKNSPVIRIQDLAMWIDANAIESYKTNPQDGIKIKYLKDIKNYGDKINFIQNTTSKQPVYRNSLINGVTGLEFDGIDDFLISENNVLSQNISQFGEITIFMVANILTSSGTGVFFKFETATSRVGFEVNDGKIRFDFPSGSYRAITSNILTNKNLILMGMSNKINQRLFINNQLSSSIANTNELDNFNNPIFLGINFWSNQYQFSTKLNFGELIIYDRALNDKERNLIASYLSQKWGIKI
jgi:hypothetical protein